MHELSQKPSTPAKQRKPYRKPALEVVSLRIKDDVLAACRTGSNATPGAGCQGVPNPCSV